jgi:hypothetical protein
MDCFGRVPCARHSMPLVLVWNILWVLPMTFAAVQIPSASAQTKPAVDEVLPKSSADLVVPILDLRYESIQECGFGQDYHCTDGPGFHHQELRWKKIEKLIARLMKDSTPSADRAAVVLLQYYVGESEGEDLLNNVTTRGKRVLPYLLKYRELIPRLPGRSYPGLMIIDRQYRQARFDEAIRAVKRGKTLNQD